MTRPKRFRSWTVAEFLEALGAVLIVIAIVIVFSEILLAGVGWRR